MSFSPFGIQPGDSPANWSYTEVGKVIGLCLILPVKFVSENIFKIADSCEHWITGKSLEGKNINQADGPLSTKGALKTMQGVPRDLKISDLEKQIKELQKQLKDTQTEETQAFVAESLKGARVAPGKNPKGKNPISDDEEFILDGEPVKRSGKVEFKQAEKENETTSSNSGNSSPTIDKTISDTIVENYVSPVKDHLSKVLADLNELVDLKTLLAEPAPLKASVTNGTVPPPPPGGQRPVANRGAPPPPPRATNPDDTVMKKFDISKEILAQRRVDLLKTYNVLVEQKKEYTIELKIIRDNNPDNTNKANLFESKRLAEIEMLEFIKTGLPEAEKKHQSFKKLIDGETQRLNEDTSAEPTVFVFTQTLGKGQVTIHELTLAEINKKELILGYANEILEIKQTIKNKILSINTLTQITINKLYPTEMRYAVTKPTSEREITEVRKITVRDYLIKENDLKQIEATLDAVKNQMKAYRIDLPKEEKIEKTESQTKKKIDPRESQKGSNASLSRIDKGTVANYVVGIKNKEIIQEVMKDLDRSQAV